MRRDDFTTWPAATIVFIVWVSISLYGNETVAWLDWICELQ